MTAAKKSSTPAAKKAPAKAPAKKAPATPASSDLAARMAGLTAQRSPATAPARTAGKAAGKTTGEGRKAPAPMPATVPSGPTYPKRMTLPLTVEDHRALRVAHLDDGVEATARLRAMLALWQQDERLRARIDKLARQLNR